MKFGCRVRKEGTVAKQGKDKQLGQQSDNDQPPKSQPKGGEMCDSPSTQVSQNNAYEDRTDE